MRGLSASFTETKTAPVRGKREPPPIWLLAKAVWNDRSRPMTSPVERISGPEHGVDAGETREREHRFLDADMPELRRLELEVRQRLAGHDACRDLGDRHADGLGDEGHGAAGARVDFQHVDLAVLDGELHVHQPADFSAWAMARSGARAPR